MDTFYKDTNTGQFVNTKFAQDYLKGGQTYTSDQVQQLSQNRETMPKVTPNTPATPSTPTISASSLAPTAPLSIPNAPVTTSDAGLGGVASSYVAGQSLKNEQQQKVDQLQQTTDATNASLLDTLKQVLRIQNSRQTLEDQAGIANKMQTVTDFQNKIDSLDKAYQQEIKALDTQFLTATEKAIKTREIDRKYNSDRADIAINLTAANRDLTTAEDLIDRKINNQLEPLKTALEWTKYFYEDNKASLDKETQNLLATKIRNDENLVKAEEAKQNTIKEITLKAVDKGVPIPTSLSSAMQNAKDSAGVLQAVSQSGFTTKIGTSGSSVGNVYKNDLDAIIGTTLSIIPTKFGQETFNNQIKRARSDGDKLNIVASQVLKNAPATDRTDFKNQSVGISFIDKAINELDSGVKTGAINNATQYTYNIFGKDFDPKIAKINGYITSAIQPYRNSVTGAAWGTQEDNEYETLFGSTKYSPTELRQRLTQMKEMLIAKSTEGLNAYVNPLNTYQNPFNYGGASSITVNGQSYNVGQVYQDGSGAKWTVDSTGKWTKQ